MKTNILTLVITLVVGVILAGSLLVPVLNDAQSTIGPDVTYTSVNLNPNPGNFDALTTSTDIEYTISTDGITYNGDSMTWNRTLNRGILIYSDAGYITVKTDDSPSPAVVVYNITDSTITNTTLTVPVTISVSNGAVVAGETTLFEFTKGFYNVNEGGKYACVYNLNNYTQSPYIKSDLDVISYGMYTTGENDTYYEYVNGEIVTHEEFTNGITVTKTLVEGTTDIYKLTGFEIDVGGETFTPYYVFIPASVTGHAASGAEYALLGAIPIMVIVAILMVAIGAIAYRRAD